MQERINLLKRKKNANCVDWGLVEYVERLQEKEKAKFQYLDTGYFS